MPAQPVNDLAARLGDVQRVAVFRALVLGDMICASPALRALRACFPNAHITLVGLPWAREWARRMATIDDFIEFPGYPGLPERSVDVRALPSFIQHMQAQRFDLAVQLHGSGQTVNGLLATWGARQVAAFCEPGQYCPDPDLSCQWPVTGTEVQRLLSLTDVLGAPRQGESLDWTVEPADRQEAASLLTAHLPQGGDQPYVCVHPGAQLASRRWPVEYFARIADQLAQSGRTVVLTGVAHEQALVQAVQDAMQQDCVNLVGQTSLWGLGALIEGASLLVCNDTGVSHVAAAVGTRSVVLSCGGDVDRWAPANPSLHRVLWVQRHCRPCSYPVCPYAHECATELTPAAVWPVIEPMLGAGS
ncbi:MAG: glycosyltransferase family 9 protein [Rubrivivax sp.]|nr:MAG: glycosyltransferase family 9 protein [Rubrivivax sp.]